MIDIQTINYKEMNVEELKALIKAITKETKQKYKKEAQLNIDDIKKFYKNKSKEEIKLKTQDIKGELKRKAYKKYYYKTYGKRTSFTPTKRDKKAKELFGVKFQGLNAEQKKKVIIATQSERRRERQNEMRNRANLS